MRLRTGKILVVLAASAVSLSVWATPLTWSLSGVTFDDGARASGSFVYDATTNQFSAVNVTTTSGALVSGATFTFVSNGFPPSPGGVLVVTTGAANETGLPAFAMFFTPGLSNAGGVASLINSQQATCGDATCSGPVAPARFVIAGTVNAALAPIPTLSTWGLIALSLILIATVGTQLRRRLAPQARA